MEASQLKQIEVFAGLPEDALELLAARAREATAGEGDVLIKAGAFADQLLAIFEGTVEVRRKDETVARLGAGDVLGETGVVGRKLRNATVVRRAPCARRSSPIRTSGRCAGSTPSSTSACAR